MGGQAVNLSCISIYAASNHNPLSLFSLTTTFLEIISQFFTVYFLQLTLML